MKVIKNLNSTHLQERLDLAPELDLPLGHAFRHLPGVPVDTGDESVAEGLVAGALVVGLDDDSLATGVSASQDQDDFSGFHNLTHLG